MLADAELYTIWKENIWPNFGNVRNDFWRYQPNPLQEQEIIFGWRFEI